MLYVGDGRTVFIVGLTFGIVLILICIMGIYGACKTNRICLLVFGIVLFVVMIVLIALSALVFIVKDHSAEYLQDYKCDSSNSIITKINEAQAYAEEVFCVKNKCPCQFDGKIPPNPQMAITSSGPKATQDCDGFPDGSKSAAALIGIVGICKKPRFNIFYFSNINNHDGMPQDELCSSDIWSFVKKSTNIVGGICVGMAVLSFLAFLSLCGICCHPKRQDYWQTSGDRI